MWFIEHLTHKELDTSKWTMEFIYLCKILLIEIEIGAKTTIDSMSECGSLFMHIQRK